MPTGSDLPMMSPWEQEGRRQALSLDECAFVLVVSDEPGPAAYVALGMGSVQALRRRVIVADAVGLLAPIDDLVPFESPHGIADVVVRGLPLAEAVHAVGSPPNLSVLPSGPGRLDRTAVLTSERWTPLSEEIRDGGALLIVVAPIGAAGVEKLMPLVDGVVLVGDAQAIAGAHVLAYVRGPATTTAMPTPRPSAAIPAGAAPEETAGSVIPDFPAARPPSRPGAISRVTDVQRAQQASAPRARTRWWLVAIWMVLLAAEAVWWWKNHRAGAVEESAPAAADSAAVRDSIAQAESGGAIPPVAPAAAPRDTAPHRPQFTIQFAALPTDSAARVAMRSIHVAGAAPRVVANERDGVTTFRVVIGPFSTREEAERVAARTAGMTYRISEGAP